MALAQESKDKLGSSSDKAQGVFDGGFSGTTTPDADRVFHVNEVDTVPVLPAGNLAMDECPAAVADSACIPNSKVFVSFIVERDGSCSGIKVVRHTCPQFDDAAMCVVRHGGVWKPGYRHGKPVRTRMMVPVVLDAR